MRTSRLLILLLIVTFALAASLVWPIAGKADPVADQSPNLDPTPLPSTGSTSVPLLRTPAAVRKHLRTTTSETLGERMVAYAKHLIGVRYSWGGSSPRTGFDCSGFVRYVYGHFGISLAHSSFSDFWRGRHVGRWSMRPGDLVFFDGAGHVGIYVGHGRFIHAPHSGTVVRISTMAGWYSTRFDGARRLVANA
jgi:cell wall-associated NlpC family hydrolase